MKLCKKQYQVLLCPLANRRDGIFLYKFSDATKLCLFPSGINLLLNEPVSHLSWFPVNTPPLVSNHLIVYTITSTYFSTGVWKNKKKKTKLSPEISYMCRCMAWHWCDYNVNGIHNYTHNIASLQDLPTVQFLIMQEGEPYKQKTMVWLCSCILAWNS